MVSELGSCLLFITLLLGLTQVFPPLPDYKPQSEQSNVPDVLVNQGAGLHSPVTEQLIEVLHLSGLEMLHGSFVLNLQGATPGH